MEGCVITVTEKRHVERGHPSDNILGEVDMFLRTEAGVYVRLAEQIFGFVPRGGEYDGMPSLDEFSGEYAYLEEGFRVK